MPWVPAVVLKSDLFCDVLSSRGGATWEPVTSNVHRASWPGDRVVVVLYGDFVVFGGFGISPDRADPFREANPTDIWVSRNAAHWWKVGDPLWNAQSPAQIECDFKALVVNTGRLGLRQQGLTFSADRETFIFADLTNWLRVDNDVSRYAWPFWPWL